MLLSFFIILTFALTAQAVVDEAVDAFAQTQAAAAVASGPVFFTTTHSNNVKKVTDFIKSPSLKTHLFNTLVIQNRQ